MHDKFIIIKSLIFLINIYIYMLFAATLGKIIEDVKGFITSWFTLAHILTVFILLTLICLIILCIVKQKSDVRYKYALYVFLILLIVMVYFWAVLYFNWPSIFQIFEDWKKVVIIFFTA